jgi:hypothetical protein
MPPKLVALIDNPVLLISILFVGAMLGILVEKFVNWQNRREWRRRRERRGQVVPFQPKQDAIAPKVPDAADQLRTVMKANFKAQPLLIEYQGGAHFKGAHATAARDAVKKEALRRAGIGYVEVVAGDTPAELRRVVERLLGC